MRYAAGYKPLDQFIKRKRRPVEQRYSGKPARRSPAA
jgi:hypothetical protein